MVDDLEEAVICTGLVDFGGAFFHSSFVSGEEVAKVDDWGTSVRRHV